MPALGRHLINARTALPVAGRGAVRAKKASEQFRIQITWSSVL